MNYIQNILIFQQQSAGKFNFLIIPSSLIEFKNIETTLGKTKSSREIFSFNGTLEIQKKDNICAFCGKKMHVNKRRTTKLRHLPFGRTLSRVEFERI